MISGRQTPISMKTISKYLLITVLVTGIPSMHAQQTNSVSAGNGISYTINGNANPPFTFQRGVTYVFLLSGTVSFHPFWIKSTLGGFFSGGAGAFDTGVINNGATSGSVIFTVPQSAPNTLFYQCGIHDGMHGTLDIIDPPTPAPTVKIVFINVADFITIRSTGTNGWTAFPEFMCGADGTNWTAVAGFTNNLVTGTNTTTFPRLEPICGATNVLVRIRNEKQP
jgi:hypothetical protein